MLVKQEQLNPCEVELEINVAAEGVASTVDETYSELGKKVNIPGFRKGKAPRMVLEQFIDRDDLRERVASKLIRSALSDALDETKIEPFAPADVELVDFDLGGPLVFKAKVPLAPVVELGEYVGLEIERRADKVTDEEVEIGVKDVLEEHAEYPLVEGRGVVDGDVVLVEMADESKPDEEPKRTVVQTGVNLPDFDKGLEGMCVDEEKVIEVDYPEDHEPEDLRGKTMRFRTKVLEIREKKIPELTDEWVMKTYSPKNDAEQEESGETEHAEVSVEAEPGERPFETADEVRSMIRGVMEKGARDAAERDLRNRIVDAIVERSNVCFPEIMVDEEIDDRLKDLNENLKKRKLTIDDYLKYKETTLDDLRENLRPDAERSLKTSLVLREIVEKENIEVKDDDVDTELDVLATGQGVPRATMRAFIEKTETMPTLRNRILTKKVLDFLVHASNIKNVG